ncbi:unnamed protein product [Heterobilharzia americana]|nr:unnamed protein product [Heterobilharzia americana]
MLSTRPSTVSQNVTNGDRVFPEKYLASISGCQAGFHSSNHMRDQTSSNSDIHSGLHAYSESISRNYVSSYLDSNLASETDSLPYALSCPDMGDYRAFENANSDHSVRLFGSQFLTSCPPAIPEVQSDVSHDEHVPHPCSCFCTFCAPILPKTYCTDVCCPKLNCLVSTDSLCKPDAFFCLLFTRRCKCRLFSFPRHRVTNENLIILSIIQLLCGFAAIVLSSVAFTKAVFLYQIATGLWAGLLMVITGFHGLFAARRPVVCALIGLLVLCMMVSLAACVLICVSVAGIIEDGFLGNTGARKAFPREIISISSGFRETQLIKNTGKNLL